MSTIPFRRPARRTGPEMPHGEVSLQEPPGLPEHRPAGMRALIMTLPMLLMMGAMTFMYRQPSSGSSSYMMMGMMGAGMALMGVGQIITQGGDRKFKVVGDRRDYLRHLSQMRRQVRGYAEKQRNALAWRHPDPESLWSLAMTSRLWERRPTHPDFGELRIGTGPQRLAVRITPIQSKPVEDLEPMSAKALRRFTRAYTSIPAQPVALFVRGFAHITVSGDLDRSRALVRAMIAQLVTFHAPDELRLAVCVAPEAAARWEWTKWLPHSQQDNTRDAAGSVRMTGATLEDVERLLGSDFVSRARYDAAATPTREEPFVVIINDGGQVAPGSRILDSGYSNTVLIDLDRLTGGMSGKEILSLELADDGVEMVKKDRFSRPVRTRLAEPDGLSINRMTTLARLLAKHRTGLGGELTVDGLTADLDLPSLLNLKDLEKFDARGTWADRPPADRLRVPIGVAADGSPIVLDIKESAEGGMGPHGMLIGATGSGKSELLRTLVLALAATHSSETLNFVLVDFKGGATFAGLDQLPHVSATITNLADQAALVDRMRDAIRGELVRRQEFLRAAGNFSSVRDYEQARAKGAPLDPLPTLFVVVDEFSELIAAHTDFIELFVMIGRLGRSLAVHLLLASQRLDDGRIHQLEGHLSYRIGLRTFSAMESRSVIGVPDAYELPSAPGNGYLRSDVATITRFKAAYVSGAYRLRSARVHQDVIQSQVVAYSTSHQPIPKVAPKPQELSAEDKKPVATTVMEVLVSRLVDQGPPAHQVWLPPLDQPPTLDQVLPPLLPDPELGLRPVDSGPANRLRVPVGLIDKPYEQIRDLLTIDLSGVGGHVGIAGGPHSGKSTLLRSVMAGLALTHSPRQVQFYCLDFGGGSLSAITDLPHVGGVTGRHDPDRVSRTIAEILAVMGARERRFTDLDVTSMEMYWQEVAAGRVPEEEFGDIFLVVDGWFTLRQEFEAAETNLREVAARGLSYGVHLLMTCGRWSEIHHTMRDKIGTKLELRLGDPVESGIDLRAAAQVPKLPGRGLTEDKLHFIAALPRIDGLGETSDLAHGTRELVSTVVDCWPGPTVRPVRTLPAVLPVEELPAPEGDLRVALGIDETQLRPVWHDFRTLPHLTVLGDNESGKSNILRLIARAIVERFSPDEAKIMAVDYRRQLFDLIPADYRLGYSVSLDSTKKTAIDAEAGLRPRIPGPEISPDQLRRRDWWQGPLLFVLVDDYDLVAGHDNPLAKLVPLLPQASDIGLTMVLARAAAGQMRMSMDPVLRRLQELNTPDLALSCPPSEGTLLGGVRARNLPPGRAMLLTRRGSRMMQTGFVPQPELEGADQL